MGFVFPVRKRKAVAILKYFFIFFVDILCLVGKKAYFCNRQK